MSEQLNDNVKLEKNNLSPENTDYNGLNTFIKSQIKYYEAMNDEYEKKFNRLGIKESNIPISINSVSTLLKLQNALQASDTTPECLALAYVDKLQKPIDLTEMQLFIKKYKDRCKELQEQIDILENEIHISNQYTNKIPALTKPDALKKKINITSIKLSQMKEKNLTVNDTKIDITNVSERILKLQELQEELHKLEREKEVLTDKTNYLNQTSQ